MDLFTNINRKYIIKCYSKNFQKNIINKYDKNTGSHDILHIGIHNLSEEIKNFKKNLHVVLLGNETSNEKLMEFFEKRKENINFYTLSLNEQDFYKEKHDINSKILRFDIPKNNTEKNRKLLYFYKMNENNDLENNKDFNNYISESNFFLFEDVKTLKIIFLEPFINSHNPYINIAFTNEINIEYINFYYISFTDVLNNFKKDYKSFEEKFFNFKNNFIKINNFIHLLTHSRKHVVNKVIDEKIHNKVNNIFSCNDKQKEQFIIISDNYEYLKLLKNNYALKIFINTNDSFIFKKIENNFISIHNYFFDEHVQDILRKYHLRNKSFEFENKYVTYNDAKIFQFIITKEEEVYLTLNYIKLFNKYNIKVPIEIYSNYIFELEYGGTIQYFLLGDFKITPNSKIYYSPDYNFDYNFNKLITTDDIEIKKIDKLIILISSTQYPSYGGAATNTYNIIKYFKKNDIFKTVGLFIDSCDDIVDKANPDNLENVIGVNYKDFSLYDIKIKLIEKLGGAPDIAFCKNCVAPKLIKNVFPDTINIFLVSGIFGFSQIECGANEIINFEEYKRNQEEKSIEGANLVICNSELTINYFKKIYGDILKNKLLEKPVDTTKYNVMHKIKSSKEKRVIDIIAIASNVNRQVKNVKFVKDILTFDKRFKKKKIVIIGENTSDLFGEMKETHNIEIISLIKQNEVENYLRKSKIIIIPSLFDSNSNVFREAVFNGVIPFISCNVAHPNKYPNFLILNDYDAVEWSYKIMYVLDNYHETTQKYSLPNLFNNNDDLLDFVF